MDTGGADESMEMKQSMKEKEKTLQD